MATTTEKPISSEVLELSSKLKKSITIDPKTGSATIAEGVYIANLPEGVTEANVKAVANYNGLIVHAAAHAFGEEGIKAFKKNREIEQLSLAIPMTGRDKIELGIRQFHDGTKPGAPADSEKVRTWAPVTAKISVASTRNRGELARVRDHLATLAMAALGDK